MSCARPGRDDAIVIGLVNAMPAAAMRSAERQFRSLLEARSGPGAIRLRLFALTDNDARPDHYEHLDALWNTRIDGLIVTGTEPRAADIARESCWPAMARVIDWADRNTISTIWSCFAAHAAVFRRDGIRRTTLPRKLSGVFTCAKSADHPLTANAPAEWTVPHSRYNTLDERDLLDAGYETLSRSPLVGADMFCRRGKKSLFLMLQGHPEYGAETLPREYRRDVLRFLSGERNCYPDPPKNIFCPDRIAALEHLREQALRRPHENLITTFDAISPSAPDWPWRAQAEKLFGRWLGYVAEHAEIGAGQLVRR